jgi:hypothetical protein
MQASLSQSGHRRRPCCSFITSPLPAAEEGTVRRRSFGIRVERGEGDHRGRRGRAERRGVGKDAARRLTSRPTMASPGNCTTREKRVEWREGGRSWAHYCGCLLAAADLANCRRWRLPRGPPSTGEQLHPPAALARPVGCLAPATLPPLSSELARMVGRGEARANGRRRPPRRSPPTRSAAKPGSTANGGLRGGARPHGRRRNSPGGPRPDGDGVRGGRRGSSGEENGTDT